MAKHDVTVIVNHTDCGFTYNDLTDKQLEEKMREVKAVNKLFDSDFYVIRDIYTHE